MKVLLEGIPASVGRTQGPVRVIQSGESGQLRDGEILVAYITDAGMFVDIIQKAAAIITDAGGRTSHPAIVAREMGIPAVVATENATQVLRTGMEVIVDGGEGKIYEPD